MSLTGWIFLIAAIVLIVGGLMILRDNARNMPISDDKMDRIRERKKEQEAKDKEEEW